MSDKHTQYTRQLNKLHIACCRDSHQKIYTDTQQHLMIGHLGGNSNKADYNGCQIVAIFIVWSVMMDTSQNHCGQVDSDVGIYRGVGW